MNSFTREEIDRSKQASIAAANDLNWQREIGRLMAAYDEIAGGERTLRAGAAFSVAAGD
jgi:hypothetical protein